MQSLGKVPSARRAPQPVNLPSLKSESGSSTPETVVHQSVQNHPNQGWTGSAPEPEGPNQTSCKQQPSPSPQPVAAPAPAPVAPVPVTAAPAPVAPNGRQPTEQARRSKTFQQEFPSLTSDPTAPAPALKKAAPGSGGAGPPQQTVVSPSEIPRQESPQPQQYGPGPSLRPQTEGSWVQGGRGPATHTQQSPTGQGNLS